MKTLLRSNIPSDYIYYRTGSRVFYEYYKRSKIYTIGKIGTGFQFFKACKIFPGFWSIGIEKNDKEISLDTLVQYGIQHGIAFWTPQRRMDMPRGWWRVPTWFTKFNIHSSRSAFSILDREDYWNKWSSNARAHRKHVLQNIETGKIRIDKEATLEQFLKFYKETKIQDPNKNLIYSMTNKLFGIVDTPHRIFIAYVDDLPLAGAIFIDEGTTSEYWASFYNRESYPYHLGIALLDTWYRDSYKKGIKYCDLDHMRDTWQSFGYSGYTKFKSSLADYDVYFHDMWVRFF